MTNEETYAKQFEDILEEIAAGLKVTCGVDKNGRLTVYTEQIHHLDKIQDRLMGAGYLPGRVIRCPQDQTLAVGAYQEFTLRTKADDIKDAVYRWRTQGLTPAVQEN